MLRNKFLIGLLFSIWIMQSEAASIKGTLLLNDTWAPVIYISVINSFDDLHTASYDFLRYKILLDSTGYFEVEDLELPEGDLIYRLHVCKKGDPESSIIIGGKDENFIHFIMNKDSEIIFNQDQPMDRLTNCELMGHPASASLSNLFDLQKKLETPPAIPSENNRVFIKNQVLDSFRSVVDSSANEVVRLLAMHFISESFVNKNHLELMERLHQDLDANNYSSSYFDSFTDKMNFLKFQENKSKARNINWLNWLSIPLVLLGLALLFRKKINQFFKKEKRNFDSLSNQEKRVFNLLKKGKSNKEISSELHIEVSTVKSHLHNIYTRLGVKSRKEIIDNDA